MKLALVFVGVFSLVAQQPPISNARPETRQVTGGLDAPFQAILATQASPAWIGYAEPILPGNLLSRCWNDGGKWWLEGRTGDQRMDVAGNQTVKLEGPTEVVVLFRVQNHRIGKIRTSTPECNLDAGGLPFIWLTGVTAPESVRFLLALAKANGGDARDNKRISDGAITAIALQADASAGAAVEELAGGNQPEMIRHQAIFWLGNSRGRRGFEVLSQIVKEDESARVREDAVFGLAQSKEPQALPALVAVARDDSSPHVRGQALFWLAQKAAQKVAESAIQSAIANDPETEVKKRAVFALTQIPNGEGVPLLIQLARTNSNPEVRKQAVFWLGQNKDPRALGFIEDILK